MNPVQFCWRYSDGHFRLQALYCNNVLNISQIIKSQTGLEILGLYTYGRPVNILKTLKELHNQLFLPIVFTFNAGHDISIFPAFYSLDRRATISQVLAQSFCKDRSNYHYKSVTKFKAGDFFQLSIYLTDSFDLPSIYTLAKDMAVNFPQINWLYLNLLFERRCEIVSFLLTVDDYNRT